jgi:iron complex transport system ATP-binding protein
MAEPTIVARHTTYRVKNATLVSGVDLDVSSGELVAVIGPNGAGKSTLLNLLAGNLAATEGEVFLNGIDLATALPGELALERSILTQRETQDIPYTAAQVVAIGRFPHRRGEDNTSERDAAAIADAMAKTETTRFAHRNFATLSSGEQTRVSLARVIAQATPVVLLDEPTTALDVTHQERIMRRAVELAREERTVVAVLHDLNAAAVYADSIVIMAEGRIVARGRPRDVLRPDLLSSVYDQPMVVIDHPFRDCPLVLTADDAAAGGPARG